VTEHMRCPSCNGEGTIQSADNFPTCSLCWGSGRPTIDAVEREAASEMRGTFEMQARGRSWRKAAKRARSEVKA
jgi:DnaJ-class molecular chaperone